MKHFERITRILLAAVMLALLFASTATQAALAQDGGEDDPPPPREEPPKPPKPDPEDIPTLPEGTLPEDLLLPQQDGGITVYDITIDIQTYADLVTVQSMSFSCGAIGECQLEVTGDALNALKAVGISFVVARKGIQAEAEAAPDALPPAAAASVSASRTDDLLLLDYGTWVSGQNYGVEITGAPDTAYINSVDYDLRIDHTYVSDLEISLFAHYGIADKSLWKRYGGVTDSGYDDDPEDDLDIELAGSTSDFDGLPVNGYYSLFIRDWAPLDTGIADHLTVTVWYDDATSLPPPFNDDMAGAWSVGSIPFETTQWTNAATLEAGEPSYSCGWSLDNTVWFRLNPSQTKVYMVDTYFSRFNAVLHVFEDLGGGSLSLVTCNDNYAGGTFPRVLFNAQVGKSYLISVGGFGGANGYLEFNVDDDIPPFTGCANQTKVPRAECKALVDLYNSTNGSSWHENVGWLVTRDVCMWYGVDCYNGHVWEIELTNNNLDGSLPASLGKLGAARHLNFYSNILTGNIPAALGNLSKLEYLNLSTNNFSGGIPKALGNLNKLTVLDLSGNALSGSIPKALGNLNKLKTLDLSENLFNGTIPWQLGKLSKLERLNLSDNNFSGAIPWQLGKLSKLEYLWLGHNSLLKGSVPPSFADLWNIETFVYNNTSLCDPRDYLYQFWLGYVPSTSGTGVTCINLFKDSFEAGNLYSWDVTQNFNVRPNCALDGDYGACAPFGKSDSRYLVKLLGSSETDLAVRFRLDVNSVPLPHASIFKILDVYDSGSGNMVFQLLLRRYSGKYQLKVIAKQDDGSTKKSGWIKIPDKPRIIEVEWEAASAPAAADGHLRLFVQGVQKAYLGEIDNDTLEAEMVTLGVLKTIKLSGKMKFDGIIIGNYGPIGMP
jgi:hypothetical protein